MVYHSRALSLNSIPKVVGKSFKQEKTMIIFDFQKALLGNFMERWGLGWEARRGFPRELMRGSPRSRSKEEGTEKTCGRQKVEWSG